MDILRKAEELYIQQTTDGDIRWRPALNMGNANLAQIQGNRTGNDERFKFKSNCKKKFNREPSGNRKNKRQPRKCWRDVGPGKGDKPDCHEGDKPIFKKIVKGRECEWCEKCNHGQGKWTTTHNTADHRKEFNKGDAKGRFNNGKSNQGEANIADSTCGLQPVFLIAEC